MAVDFDALEGRHVSLALTDGSRIDDCQLVRAPREGMASVWVHANGIDAVVPISSIGDAWEVSSARIAARGPAGTGPTPTRSRRPGYRSRPGRD